MKVSTKGRYAIRLMIDVAVNSNGNNVSLKEISSRQNISVKYLEQIVGQLSKFGLLKSTRGSQGGYKLVKEPNEYKIGDILRVTEGDLAPISCLEGGENICPRSSDCTTLGFWEGLYVVINEYVDKYTLEDLIKECSSNNEIDYII